jgi:hypothetical protein
MNLTSLILEQNRQDVGLGILIAIVIVYLISRWLNMIDTWLNNGR